MGLALAGTGRSSRAGAFTVICVPSASPLVALLKLGASNWSDDRFRSMISLCSSPSGLWPSGTGASGSRNISSVCSMTESVRNSTGCVKWACIAPALSPALSSKVLRLILSVQRDCQLHRIMGWLYNMRMGLGAIRGYASRLMCPGRSGALAHQAGSAQDVA